MAHYFVSNFSQTHGNHEVHSLGCVRMPRDTQYLGNFSTSNEALMEARKGLWNSSTCPACSREFAREAGAPGAAIRAAHFPLRFR